MFGLSASRDVTPDRYLTEGDEVGVGELRFSVLHVPGHTPGHIVFVHKAARIALVGDTVFAGSIGRTDFAYGDHAALIAGIKTKLLPLGDDMAFLPGHGPASTMGAERRTNPFLQE
jgi:glyoxylase-like metal-dependent hydrolase (beta-lactamase superfamily II)